MSVLGGSLQSYFTTWQGNTGILGFAEHEIMSRRFRFKFRKGDNEIVKYLYEDDADLPFFISFLNEVQETYFKESEIAKEVENIIKYDNPFGRAKYEITLYFKSNGHSETVYCQRWGHLSGLIWYMDISSIANEKIYIPYDMLMKIKVKEFDVDEFTDDSTISNS